MRSLLRKIKSGLSLGRDVILPKFFIWSPWASSLYYFLFSSKFRRENYAVLCGKTSYLRTIKKTNRYTLIRNTHRLEKGLLMRPRREVYAVDYIQETINHFEAFYSLPPNIEEAQLQWSFDVLSEYFAVTGDNSTINKQRERFYKIIKRKQRQITEKKHIPYYRQEQDKPQITYAEFYKLTKYRRSVRWFLDKKVPHEMIDKAILAALQSPSACNRQPFEYRIIDEPHLLKELVNIPMGIKGYEYNVPMLIVVVGNLDAYFDERDRHVIYIDASLANMTFMFALETMGLSSCAINWPDIESLEKKMERKLQLQKQQRPIMLMAVGYPDPEGMVACSEKRNLNDLRKYN